MGKVFRLHDGQNGVGWFQSIPFTDQDLDTIKTKGKEVSNSIPSPFARIDLVNEAFKWVARHGVSGTTAQHKLVSDALDVGQLFFNSNKFRDLLEVAEYNPNMQLAEYFRSSSNVHKEFAHTLNTYWEQDGEVYHFNKTDKVYLLLYQKEIIGATSPISLFFSAPLTEKQKSNIHIDRGIGKYFDKEPLALPDREWDFIEYLFLLSKQSSFADLFPNFYKYLEEV